MKPRAVALVVILVLAGCDISFVEPGYRPPEEPGPGPAEVVGDVLVGPYPAREREVVVFVYTGRDSVNHLYTDSVSREGTYRYPVGSFPDEELCDYRIRARRWDGVETPLQPLIASPPAGCVFDRGSVVQGTVVEFPAYATLDEPFVVEGGVFVDGEPALPEDVVYRLEVRDTLDRYSLRPVTVNAAGRARYETVSGAERFQFCGSLLALVDREGGSQEQAYLNEIDLSQCGRRRRMPDVRFGQRVAVEGFVRVGPGGRWAGDGEVTLQLLHPADSAAYGEAVTTHDDGSYRLWFPADAEDPGCDFLVEATHEDGTRQVLQAITPDNCSGTPSVSFHFHEGNG